MSFISRVQAARKAPEPYGVPFGVRNIRTAVPRLKLGLQIGRGDEWLHEVKHDGYRTLLVVERPQVRAYTRTGLDWTDRYPVIFSACVKLRCRSAILDGEVIVQDERGASDFDALKSAIKWQPHRLIFYAFDLLHLGEGGASASSTGTEQ